MLCRVESRCRDFNGRRLKAASHGALFLLKQFYLHHLELIRFTKLIMM